MLKKREMDKECKKVAIQYANLLPKMNEYTCDCDLVTFEGEDSFLYRNEIELLYQNDNNNNFIKEVSKILPDSLVEILVLKYACNLRNKDIASILDITKMAVLVRDRRVKTESYRIFRGK